MKFIHVTNLEKYHPGYKDRALQWAKIYINMAQGDPDTELIEDEIDWSRLIKFILIELRAKKPLPYLDSYWQKKGFDLKRRPLAKTIECLANFIEVIENNNVTDSYSSVYESVAQIREEKIREDKDIHTVTTESVLLKWNSFCERYPVLAKVVALTAKRSDQLKTRLKAEAFDFDLILKAIEEQPFLRGESERHWKVTFDWIIKNDTNYLKILEGQYKEGGNADDRRNFKN